MQRSFWPGALLIALLLRCAHASADPPSLAQRRALYARSTLGFGGLGIRKSNIQAPENGTSGSGVQGELELGGRALPWLAVFGSTSGFYSWAPQRNNTDGSRTPLGQSQHIASLELGADIAPLSLHDVHFRFSTGGALLSQEDQATGTRDRRRGLIFSLGLGHDWMVHPAFALGLVVRVAGGRLWARDRREVQVSTEADKFGLFTVGLTGLLR